MSLFINTNMLALNTANALKRTSTAKEKASARLSSGRKINSASDDAAGLAISEKMRAQIRGLQMAEKNTEDGMSLLTVQDGGMNEISDMIIRQRELIIQALNDTNTPEDRMKIQEEINALTAEIDATAYRTQFNNIPLLTGGPTSSISGPTHISGLNVQNILPASFGSNDIAYFAAGADTGTSMGIFGYGTCCFGLYNQSGGYEFYDVMSRTWANATVSSPEPGVLTMVLDTTVNGYPVYMKRTISIVDGDNPNEQFYKIEETIENRSSDKINMDYLFYINPYDIDVHGSGEQFIETDNSGTPMTHEKQYSGSSIPGRIDIYNTGNEYAMATIIIGSNGADTPDEVAVGSNRVLDINTPGAYHYDVDETSPLYGGGNVALLWKDFEIDADSSKTITMLYGITRLNVPPDYNSGNNSQAYKDLFVQTGANANQGMYISRYDCRVNALGINNIRTDPREEALKSLSKLDSSMSVLSGYRATNGSEYNRLEFTRNSLGISSVNLEDANSRIADADMAKEMMIYTKQNVLAQAAVSMLTQANQSPEMVLRLLK